MKACYASLEMNGINYQEEKLKGLEFEGEVLEVSQARSQGRLLAKDNGVSWGTIAVRSCAKIVQFICTSV